MRRGGVRRRNGDERGAPFRNGAERRFALGCGSLLVAFGAGCLPVDTRPPPAEVQMTASSSVSTREGIDSTIDGWQIAFERVLASIGQAYVGDENEEGGGCSEYSNPQYTRIFDFTVVDAPEKVGLAFALGTCRFGYVVRFPNWDAVIGTGATTADGDYMRTPRSDRYATDAGISLYVIGSAHRDGVTKQFEWEFRERLGYRECWVPDGDTKVQTFSLESGGSATMNVEIQAENLFRDQLNPNSGMLRFQPFADSDTNDDGEVTLDELDATQLSDLEPFYDFPTYPGVGWEESPLRCADTDGVEVVVKTLGDYAYCALAPSVARFQSTGGCKMAAGRRRPPDD